MKEVDAILKQIGEMRIDGEALVGNAATIVLISRRQQTNGVHVTLQVREISDREPHWERYSGIHSLVKLGQRDKLLREILCAWAVLMLDDLDLKKRIARSKEKLPERLPPSLQAFFDVVDLGEGSVKEKALSDLRMAMSRASNNVDITLEDVTRIWEEIQVEKIHNG